MLITEFKIIPMTLGVASSGGVKIDFSGVTHTIGAISPQELAQPFLFLLIIQGFFAGLVIGKLSEGNVKAGLKHSFILMMLAWLITTGARAFIR